MKCAKTKQDAANPDFWNQLYLEQDLGWDLGTISPPLEAFFKNISCKNTAILIPGCGNAYEAAWLLENGFKNITLIDIAPRLIETLLKKFEAHIGKELTLIAGDFFKHNGQYDLIIEQTFFCALDPSLRPQYSAHMYQLLNPGGKLAGLLFDKQFENSPPFGGSKVEYIALFQSLFTIDEMNTCSNSVKPRMGTELFFEFTRKNTAS